MSQIPLTDAIKAECHAQVDALLPGDTMMVRLRLNERVPPSNPMFSEGRSYLATKQGTGRALHITDNQGHDRIILLAEPCPYHYVDPVFYDVNPYWVPEDMA